MCWVELLPLSELVVASLTLVGMWLPIYISGSNSIHMKSVKAKSMEKESKVLHGKIKQYLRRETKTNNSKVT